MDLEKISEIFSALGNEKRLAIVLLLKKKACLSVGDIVKNLDVPQATVSQHLRILRMAGIVRGERKDHNVCYKIINDYVIKILDNCVK
jgi:ArsR family transcriptional regulator